MRSRSRYARTATLAIAMAALFLPGQALAEYYIPPGNSAANQYKEAFPAAGGDATGGKGKVGVTPAQALGAGNARRLESKGAAGKAAAEVAAATAPGPISTAPGPGDSAEATRGNSSGSANGSADGSANGSADAAKPGGGGSTASPNGGAAKSESGNGASPISSALGQATGASDDGNLGLWLPILILAAIAVAVAYRLRMRSGPHHGSTA
jgi:hypothetical protein